MAISNLSNNKLNKNLFIFFPFFVFVFRLAHCSLLFLSLFARFALFTQIEINIGRTLSIHKHYTVRPPMHEQEPKINKNMKK